MPADNKTRFKIGRSFGLGPMHYSFELVWKGDGVIALENEDKVLGPNSAEKEVIYRHLKDTMTGIEGAEIEGGDRDRFVEIAPGTLDHFQMAAYQMPKPFGRMPI